MKEEGFSSSRCFVGRTFSLEHLSCSGKEASSNLTQLSTSANDKVDTYGCNSALRSVFLMTSDMRGRLYEFGYNVDSSSSSDSPDSADLGACSAGRSGMRDRGMTDKVI